MTDFEAKSAGFSNTETQSGQKRPLELSDDQMDEADDDLNGVDEENGLDPPSTTTDATDKAPITLDGEKPRKTFYRQRAHCNPLSHNDAFDYPLTPQHIDWTTDHFPNLATTTPDQTTIVPTVLDVGCGFGGLTLALATILPKEVILGMEIRAKVSEYVRLRIVAARKEKPDSYENCSVLRSNSMKYLPNYFAKASIHKLFFCFPDPHFKRKNHPRRIISERLLSEYAFVLQPGGKLYCITDVSELHQWHVAKCNAHALFRKITDDAFLRDDPCVRAMKEETEEGKKVSRNKGSKYYAVYERIENDQAPQVHAGNFF